MEHIGALSSAETRTLTIEAATTALARCDLAGVTLSEVAAVIVEPEPRLVEQFGDLDGLIEAIVDFHTLYSQECMPIILAELDEEAPLNGEATISAGIGVLAQLLGGGGSGPSFLLILEKLLARGLDSDYAAAFSTVGAQWGDAVDRAFPTTNVAIAEERMIQFLTETVGALADWEWRRQAGFANPTLETMIANLSEGALDLFGGPPRRFRPPGPQRKYSGS